MKLKSEYEADIRRRTRNHFARIHIYCIRQAKGGTIRVNDLPAYIAWHLQLLRDVRAGKQDHTFTLRQYADYLRTGTTKPLL